MRDYISRGLAALVLSGSALYSTGCATAYHQVFRNNEDKNEAPVADIISMEQDYAVHDSQFERVVQDDRAYFKGSTPENTIQETVNIPSYTRYTLDAINASYIQYGGDNIIMQYKSRIPAPDLKKLVDGYFNEIKVSEIPNQNMLKFTGKKSAFGDFKDLSAILNELDRPAEQIRVKLRIVEYFNDNTYDRDLSLKFLKDSMEAFSFNLPSSADPTQSLSTGISFNPFF